VKVLRSVTPTPEQLPLLTRNQPGAVVIRGAAGSGKTTTALLRIRFLASAWSNRRLRLGLKAPVRVLVLTYNRTLRGYLAHMAEEMAGAEDVELEVSTFARWAMEVLKISASEILPPYEGSTHLAGLCRVGFTHRAWAAEEAEYAMGRFLVEDYSTYLDCDRQGRRKPCDRKLRQRLLDHVILPHQKWLDRQPRLAFASLPSRILSRKAGTKYDVVVIDEAQDFTANEARAVMSRLAPDHSITFVLDAAQRIYPRGFTWKEVGVAVSGDRVHTLKANYRNTRQIARFVTPLLDGIDVGEDGALPDLTRCDHDGPIPLVLVGKYDPQVGARSVHLPHPPRVGAHRQVRLAQHAP
jgi:DNA helicase IV